MASNDTTQEPSRARETAGEPDGLRTYVRLPNSRIAELDRIGKRIGLKRNSVIVLAVSRFCEEQQERQAA